MPETLLAIEELKQVRWVEEAVKYGDEDVYEVKTKAGSLKIDLTHKIRLGGSSYDHKYTGAEELPHRITIDLPQYWIRLYKSGFRIAFTEEPKGTRDESVGFWPQYQETFNKGLWDTRRTPCYGDADRQADNSYMGTYELYCAAPTWRERANIAAYFLQVAEPHYGYNWYKTSFAYRLGLVGEEVFVEPTEEEKAAELAREEARAQATMRVINGLGYIGN